MDVDVDRGIFDGRVPIMFTIAEDELDITAEPPEPFYVCDPLLRCDGRLPKLTAGPLRDC